MKEGKKIISFSLWGQDDKYCIGAIRNVELQRLIYPGWTCRFYIDKQTVPSPIIDRLFTLGCEIKFRTNFHYGAYPVGKFWRHSIMNDPTVERFIVRDADSRLSEREKHCVDAWIASGKSLHVIRDHPHHGHRIMGGMWGGLSSETAQLDYEKLLSEFLKQVNYTWPKKKMMDQKFLSDMIYPQFKGGMYIHDNQHFFRNEQPHKIKRKDKNFIGEIVDVKGVK